MREGPSRRTTQQLSITLPHDMAEVVERKLESGAYATVSEVLRDGVRALMERDAAIDRWLREQVVLTRPTKSDADPHLSGNSACLLMFLAASSDRIEQD